MSPGVDGGGIPAALRPGVDTAWLDAGWLGLDVRAGEFLRPSSFFTVVALGSVGDATEPDMLRALSSWSRFGSPVVDDTEPPNGFRRPVPFAAGPLPFAPFDCIAGDGAGLPF